MWSKGSEAWWPEDEKEGMLGGLGEELGQCVMGPGCMCWEAELDDGSVVGGPRFPAEVGSCCSDTAGVCI